jgi:hypothetical protein
VVGFCWHDCMCIIDWALMWISVMGVVWSKSELSTFPHQLKLLGWTGWCMSLNMVLRPEVSCLSPGGHVNYNNYNSLQYPRMRSGGACTWGGVSEYKWIAHLSSSAWCIQLNSLHGPEPKKHDHKEPMLACLVVVGRDRGRKELLIYFLLMERDTVPSLYRWVDSKPKKPIF